jgi:hypothetical protein
MRIRLLRVPVISALAFALLLVASLIALRLSIITGQVRVLLAFTLLMGVFTGSLWLLKLLKSHPRALYPTLALFLLFVAWATLGSKPVNVDALRSTYIQQLHSFEGVRYVWGGETHSGIDCSGLGRVALWQAMAKQGVKEANPRLLGPLLWKFWWQDLSARAMSRGGCGYTKTTGHARKLAGYDASHLKPGDIAVTKSGVHVLVYYGNGRWIDASPDEQRVTVSRAPADSKRGWFNMPVVFVRWRILDN